MTTINQLSAADTLSGGDLFAVYKQSQGDARKSSLTNLADFVSKQTPSVAPTTQYAVPTTTEFQVAVNQDNTWLLMKPTGTFATGTITFKAAPADKSEITITSIRAVGTLTITAASSTINGAPNSIGINGFIKFKYDLGDNTWYRVG